MGKQWKQWETLLFWSPKSLQIVIAAMKLKDHYRQPRQHVKKQRHYFANKVHLVKAMVFPVVMYGCESWTIKKPKRQGTDVFEVWCWRRFLRVPRTARRSNQSILKEMNPNFTEIPFHPNSLEGLMLKLKRQYFGHLGWRANSLEKTLMLGKTESKRTRDDRRWDGWMASWTHWTWV